MAADTTALGIGFNANRQMFSGIRIVKAFGLESEKVQEYAERNEDYARQTMATEITKAFTRMRMEAFVFGAITLASLGTLLHVAAPWVAAQAMPGAVAVYGISGVLMLVSYAVMSALPLWEMWRS